MYNKKTKPLLYTAVFGFILINKPIFADTDAGFFDITYAK